MDVGSANPLRSTATAVALIALAAAAITAAIYVMQPPHARIAKALLPPKSEPAAAPRFESGVVLLAGETLVAPPPTVTTPAGKPAATAPRPEHAPTPPRYVQHSPSLAASNAPQYTREEQRRRTRTACVTCAKVVGVSEYPTHWEVRVRFSDGSRDAITYRDRPPFDIGDAVRMERGRLYRN